MNRKDAARWLTHWLSALAVIVLLATSLPLAYFTWLRPPLRLWASFHLSAGYTLLALTIWRVAVWRGQLFGAQGRAIGLSRLAVKAGLLAMLALALGSGLFIFRPSPLTGKAFLFGLFEVVPPFTASHEVHMVLLDAHRAVSFVLGGLLLFHILIAFRRISPRGPLPVAWLWRPGGTGTPPRT